MLVHKEDHHMTCDSCVTHCWLNDNVSVFEPRLRDNEMIIHYNYFLQHISGVILYKKCIYVGIGL